MTKNIVVVGGGAGGLELVVGLAKKLKKNKEYSVILVDCEKTHIWKPHLHQIAAGSMYTQLEQIDYLHLASKYGFQFVLGRFLSCDDNAKTITLDEIANDKNQVIIPARNIEYDTLIMAIGSTSNDFGTKGVSEHSFSLDNLPTAEKFHDILLEKIMKKENMEDNTPLKITIIGGGATGVELAAELSETIKILSQFGMKKLQVNKFQLTVINAADVLLPGLSSKISSGAQEILNELNVKVFNSSKVIEVGENFTTFERGNSTLTLDSDMTVWAAGVKSSDVLKNIPNITLTRGNQICVNANLRANGQTDIFAIGDCASIPWSNGPRPDMTVPPRAQAAHQMSSYLVKYLIDIRQSKSVPAFQYKDFGSLISLGGEDTVGTLMGFLKGKSLFIEGKIAKIMYLTLYHGHQITINGFFPAIGMLLGKMIQNQFKPKVKLY